VSHDLTLVDTWASAGTSAFHRASALSKLAFVVLILVSILSSTSPIFLGGLWVGLILLVILSGVPLLPALGLSLYPVLFSSLYLLSRWDGNLTEPTVIVLRSLSSSLTAVLLVATTPYPDLFAPIARVTPRLVGDGLFLTYRAFFLLVARADRMWIALRLRGGLTGRGLPRDFRAAGEGLGSLVIHSYDRSQRLYAIMHIRGHSGRVCGCRHWAEFTAYDLVPLGLGLLALGLRFALEGR
jgi:cobalt/nickel transport system permease protein